MDPKVLPLAAPIGARYESLTVDSRLVNAFAEKAPQSDEVWVYKRPGFGQLSFPAISAGTGRGIFYWGGSVYSIFDGTVYKDGVALVGSVTNSGMYTFSSCLGSDPVLFIQNTVDAYTIDAGGTITQVTDSDYPATTAPGSAYLDGTTYVLTPDSKLYGSDATTNDPASWDPANLILVQLEPDAAIALAKQLVYVVALKEFYTEVFYDAGNATGSPLGPVQGSKINFGCVDARTVRAVGGDLAWVARTREGEVCAVLMSATQPQVISSPREDRILANADYSGNVYSWAAKVDGHRFYGVTIVESNLTLVYDLTSGMWYQWTDEDGNYLPYCDATINAAGTQSIFQHESNGKLYTPSISLYEDSLGPFTFHVYTPNYDGGTRRKKTLARMDLMGDMVSGSTVSVEYSDDDYGSWVAVGSYNMAEALPTLANLGEFTRRAFHFYQADDEPLRIKAAEMYLQLGPA